MERKDIVLCIRERSVGMDLSNGYSRRKHEKQCDKHSVTWSKVEWSEVGWI